MHVQRRQSVAELQAVSHLLGLRIRPYQVGEFSDQHVDLGRFAPTDEELQRARRKGQPLTGAAPSPDDDVAELEALRASGILTDEEFERAKEKALTA